MPGPYVSGPGISFGKAPRFSVRQRGQVLISASTVNSRVSKTRSTLTRRSVPAGATPSRPRPQARHSVTGAVRVSATTRVGAARLFGPLPWAPGRRAVSSAPVCELGRPELRELFGVFFSRNTAINSSNSINSASNRARPSGLILPFAHSASKRALSAPNSVRSDTLFTVAIGYPARPP